MTSLDKPTDAGRTEPDGLDAETDDSRAATQAALFDAFGGIRGLVETTLPGLLFIGIFTVNQDLHAAAIAALIVSGVLVIARLATRSTIKHAFSGVFGVVIGVAIAMMTGNPKDFYLPGLLYTVGFSLTYLISAFFGFPLLGMLLGPVFRENLSWRTRNPGRKRAYVKASYAWGWIFLVKAAILFPLYLWGDPTRFGWVTIALKIPPILLAVYLTWIFLAKAPPPIDVIAEMEAEEEAAKAAEAADAAEEPADTAAAEAPPRAGGGRHRR